MRTIDSLFKRLSSTTEVHKETELANPSEVLRVNREDIAGTLEIRNLDGDDNPSNVLRVSWIKRDNVQGIMKTVWVTDEFELI